MQQIIDSISDGHIELDRELRVVGYNDVARRLLRIRSLSSGQLLSEVVPDARKTDLESRIAATGQSRRPSDTQIFCPSLYVWHALQILPTEDGFVLLFRDITEPKWTVRYEAEKAYLRSIFEDAPVAILLLRGSHHTIEYMNALCKQLIGKRNVEGLSIRDAFPDVEQQNLFDIMDSVFQTGEAFHGRDIYVRFDRDNDGELEEGYFDVTYQPVRDFDGKITGIINISIEVTDRGRERPASG